MCSVTILQYSDGESLAGVGSEPAPEVVVRGLGADDLCADPLQLAHPRVHDVAVLQHHPAARLDGRVDHVGGDGALRAGQVFVTIGTLAWT